MRLLNLSLRQFRNIRALSLAFSPGLNLLIGPNAQGKTNVIEAIGLVSTGHSFRTQEFRDMIHRDEADAEVRARSRCTVGDDAFRVQLTPERKHCFCNDKRIASSGNRGVLTVLFAPEEILLLKGSPSGRRHYLDTLIAQLHRPHRTLATHYEKVVRHRNRLIQDPTLEGSARRGALLPWDEQLIELGARLLSERAAWCARLGQHLPGHYRAIAPGDPEATITYAPHCGPEVLGQDTAGVAAVLRAQLEQRRGDEAARRVTLVGPHRDDLEAGLGGTPVKHFGSQGQHRSFVLALKMAEMDLMREVAGEEPILLLDDVASELDERRNRHFFETLKAARGQVFVTATRDQDVQLTPAADAAFFDVLSGDAVPRK